MKTVDKLPVFEWFYRQGDVYLTILIMGSNELKVPPHFYNKDVETFVVGDSPTPHLICDEHGISTPMRFGAKFFNCFFPWENIIMMTGENAMIQFRVKEKYKIDKKENASQKKEESTSKKTSYLKVIK